MMKEANANSSIISSGNTGNYVRFIALESGKRGEPNSYTSACFALCSLMFCLYFCHKQIFACLARIILQVGDSNTKCIMFGMHVLYTYIYCLVSDSISHRTLTL